MIPENFSEDTDTFSNVSTYSIEKELRWFNMICLAHISGN